MGKIDENRLKADIKAGKLARAYFLYGSEDYLVHFFAEKMAAAAVPEESRDMNIVRYTELPEVDALSDQLENMPFFSDYKCVLIKDLDIDGMDNATHKAYLSLIESIPETSVLVIAQENIAYDMKKLKAKPKKLMAAVEAVGVSCEMKYMAAGKLAQWAQKQAAGAGCALSPQNAAYLAQECGSSMTALENEIAKLCAYKVKGEITEEDIGRLVPRRIDSNVFQMARELFDGRSGRALEILNDAFAQNTDPINMLAALSLHFTDLYRARLAITAGLRAPQAQAAYHYLPNRGFAMEAAYRSVGRLSERYLGECVAVLYRTNKLLNSSTVNKRQLIERAIIEIAGIKRQNGKPSIR